MVLVPRLKNAGTAPVHDDLPVTVDWDPSTKILSISKCPQGQDPGGDATDDPDCTMAPKDLDPITIVMTAQL